MADQDREADGGIEDVEFEPNTEKQRDLNLTARDAESVKGGGGGVRPVGPVGPVGPGGGDPQKV